VDFTARRLQPVMSRARALPPGPRFAVRGATVATGVAAVLLCAAACGGSAPPPVLVSPTPAGPSQISCGGSHGPSHVGAWPKPVPATLPKPPTGTKPKFIYRSFRLSVARLTTQLSLRDSVLFVLDQLPKAGFVLGRGDAEPGQADAPFTGGGVYGQIRLNSLSTCRTQWLIAVAPPANAGSPLLPRPTPSVSPVPFGSFGFGG
jgi:hypothetical protein